MGLGLLLVAGAAFGQNLTFGSWRVDDVAKWTNIIADFNKTNPNIKIKFDPTTPADYNATLRLQLDNGNGPDIFFARSFAAGQDLFKAGYELDLTSQAFVKNNYVPSALSAFSSDGKVFALPAAAVSHGIYYNVDLFKKYGIAVPKTWPELIAAAKKLKDNGVTPFGNGLAGNWDILEVVLMNILPATVGGADGRVAYETGKRKLNDASIVAAFQQLKDLTPYLPKGFEAVTDNDAVSLFQLGKAAMVFWGSWDIPAFTDKIGTSFAWSIFASPPPAGKANVIEFQPDFGVAINPKAKSLDAAKTFLAWLAGPEGGKSIAENLTGFFPMSKNAVTLSNPYANTFISFNKGTTQDFRFTWDKLSANKLPSYTTLLDESNAVLKGTHTPQQAADAFAAAMAAAGFKP
jgi:raffinose/stachyose/melibiose transport system substrate-binding protein